MLNDTKKNTAPPETVPERLGNKEGPKGDGHAWISVERRNTRDLLGRLGNIREGNMRDWFGRNWRDKLMKNTP